MLNVKSLSKISKLPRKTLHAAKGIFTTALHPVKAAVMEVRFKYIALILIFLCKLF